MKVRRQDNFQHVSQSEEVKYTIIRTLECLRGIFPTCYASFSDTLFQYFQPVIEDTVSLVPIYDTFTVIIVAILEMYVDIMEHVLCFLNAVGSSFFSRQIPLTIWTNVFSYFLTFTWVSVNCLVYFSFLFLYDYI